LKFQDLCGVPLAFRAAHLEETAVELSTTRRSPAAAPIARVAALALTFVFGLTGAARAESITIDADDSFGSFALAGISSSDVEFYFEGNGVSAFAPLIQIVDENHYLVALYGGTFATAPGPTHEWPRPMAPLAAGMTIGVADLYSAFESVFAAGFTAAGSDGAHAAPLGADGQVRIPRTTAWAEPSNWFVLHYFRYEEGAATPSSAMAAFTITWLDGGAAAEITLMGTVAGTQYVIPGGATGGDGVTEPGTIALAGLGAGAAFVGRRRAARR